MADDSHLPISQRKKGEIKRNIKKFLANSNLKHSYTQLLKN
jgi:hypothetical protein